MIRRLIPRDAGFFVFLASGLALGCGGDAAAPVSGDGGVVARDGDAGRTLDSGREASRADGQSAGDAVRDAVDASADRHDGAGARDAPDEPRADSSLTDGRMPDASSLPDAAAPDAAKAEASIDAGPPALRYIGRTLTDGTDIGAGSCTVATPCFEWSGTQVVARFTGATGIGFEMADDGNYFDVYVDGVLSPGAPIIGDSRTGPYPAAAGLDASETHEVRLYKRTEATTAGPTLMNGVTFPAGGTLLPPLAPPPTRIEVIGDSISCGYGVLGADAECVATAANEDHDDSYGAIAARNLQADLFTLAASGYGVYEDDTGNTANTLPSIYGMTVPFGAAAPGTWSFAAWVPTVVVIDLGTNDFAGSGGDPGQPFVTAYAAFLHRVRQNYPAATIVCATGPMLTVPYSVLAQMYVQQAISMVNDPKVLFMSFDTQSQVDTDEGCEGHPNVTTQQAMAVQLTSFLQPLL